MIDVTCPVCKETRQEDANQKNYWTKTCGACWPKVELERRLDTKRRPTEKSSCEICVDPAKFEYFLKPPRTVLKQGRETDRFKRLWLTLCDRCFKHWLKEGRHYIDVSPSFSQVGSMGRPLMQDEWEEREVARAYPRDSSTTLLTNEWRRQRPPWKTGYREGGERD